MRRIEWMAVGWGGLIAAIALLAVAERSSLLRLAILVAAFTLGGFLAGVRAAELRPVHGMLAAIAAYAFHALFVVVATLVDLVGGPAPPAFVPGQTGSWFGSAAVAVAAATIGAGLAALWLRPQREDRRRRIG